MHLPSYGNMNLLNQNPFVLIIHTRLIQKATELDPIAIYNFDATKLLWRLYELIDDVVQLKLAFNSSKTLIWTNLSYMEFHCSTKELVGNEIASGARGATITEL